MAFRSVAIMVVVCSALAGCVSSQATPCGDVICPAGRVCAQNQCVAQAIATACARQADGASCTLPEIGVGTCQNGLCLVGTCGDGVINAIDACDGSDLGGKTCLDFGATGASGLRCTADCAFDLSRCVQYCGDGVKNTIEPCDGTDFDDQTCITQGFYEGDLVCTQDCQINTASCRDRCGDGIKNGFEPCDGSDFGADSCAARGFGGAALVPLTCGAGCALDPISCTCGDEVCPDVPGTQIKQRCELVDNIPTCVNPPGMNP